jgi:hypothetical protein
MTVMFVTGGRMTVTFVTCALPGAVGRAVQGTGTAMAVKNNVSLRDGHALSARSVSQGRRRPPKRSGQARRGLLNSFNRSGRSRGLA